jgi:transposase
MALEATGSIWPVVDSLRDLGAEVYVANPVKNRLIGCSDKKSDPEDARKLAHLLRTNYLPTVYIPTREEREMRFFSRERTSLVRVRTGLKNQAKSILQQEGNFSQEINSRKDRKSIKESSNGRVRRRIRLIESFDSEIKGAEKEISEKVSSCKEAQLLMTVPGIAEYSAVVIMGEICNIHRFPTSDQFCAYCGLAPSIRQSGDSLHMGAIRKNSNHRLRWLLIQDAWIAVRHDERLRKFFEKKKNQKGEKKAIVAAANKLATYVYWVLKRGVEFKQLASA